MSRGRASRWAALVVLAFAAGLQPAGAAGAEKARTPASQRLKRYPSRYYIIYSDLDANAVREASARMSAMAEEYHRRTKDFAGAVRTRLPFYLFSKPEDYYDAGATKGSAGVYHPGRRVLMALAEYGTTDQLWHVVQHEGFHQFVHMVIRGQIPVWVNEGMAEYFGQAIWTGDGFITGVIPPGRLQGLQGHIRGDKILPFRDMLLMSYEEWSEAVEDSGSRDEGSKGPKGPGSHGGGKGEGEQIDRSRINYDQAWSMVHFLVHADEGKYRRAFSAMIRDISRGREWIPAFQARFGRNVKAFEKRYRDWWLAQPENPTTELYIKAVVQTLTSFLARAVSQGQKFQTAEEFFREARSGNLKSHKAQWLPPSLLNRVLLYARNWKRGWSLDAAGRSPKLVLTWPDGKTFTGTFTHSGGRAYGVKVTITEKED
jgi:hypothetical protein